MIRVHAEQSRAIVSGVVWNFCGQGCLLVVAFLATPYIVGKLQADLYGLYALAGFVLSYFAFLEFGLGAAVTKFISEHLAQDNEEEIVNAFWGGVTWLALGGLICLSVVATLAEFIASTLLKVPPQLQPTAVLAFRVSSLLLCASMWTGLTAGTLRSVGQFGILNLTTTVAGTVQTALAVGLLWAGYSLAGVLWGMVVCQGGVFAWQFSLCLRFLPALRRPQLSPRAMARLLGYGGVLTVASIMGPILSNVEKLLMARLTSVGLLTYYAVPFSLIDRLGLIPSAFGGVLFPSFSYFSAREPRYNRELHYRGTLYICASYGFFAAFFLSLGKPFLDAWMGAEFAYRSGTVLGILALGGLFNAMARPAVTALQGVGKPHLPLLIQCVELVLYVPSAYWLVRSFGMLGAAEAWCGRVILDALLLHVVSCRELGESMGVYWKLAKSVGAPLGACWLAFLTIGTRGMPLLTPIAFIGIVVVASGYAVAVWRLVLDAPTRERMTALWKWA